MEIFLSDFSFLVYRNARVSCNFMKFNFMKFLNSSSFLDLLCIVSCHLHTVTVLLLFFQFESFYFFFFLWWPWLGLPKLYWIKMVRVDILVLFLILEKMFSVFNVGCDASFGFFIYDLHYVEVGPSMPTFWRIFVINRFWILSKAFLHLLIIIWFLFFYLSVWCGILNNLCILKDPYIPGKNPAWSWCMIILIYCWIWLANILLMIFTSIFISDTGL